MNRRQFLATPGFAAAALAASNRPIGAAFLGASYSHAKEKLKIMGASPSFHLVSVWDEDEAVRQKLASQGLKVVAPDQMLRDSAVEVVLVESDVPDHQRHAKMALEAGKHVHLENRRLPTWRPSANCWILLSVRSWCCSRVICGGIIPAFAFFAIR